MRQTLYFMSKKYFIYWLFSLSFISCLFAQNPEYDSVKEQKRIVNSFIKSGVAIGYPYDKQGRKKPAGHKEFMEMYDKKGLLRQYIIYDNNQIKERWSFKYNKKRLKTGALCYNGREELLEKYTIQYKSGKASIKTGEKNGTSYKISYKYEKNKLIEETKTIEGIEIHKTTSTYNSSGNITKKVYTKKSLTVTTDYLYNENNLLISEKIYVNDALDHYINYKYNQKNQKYQETKINNKGISLTEYTYFYTSDGKIKKIALFDFNLGYEQYSWVYTYDGNGSINKMFSYSSRQDIKSTKKQIPIYVREHTYRYFTKPKVKK